MYQGSLLLSTQGQPTSPDAEALRVSHCMSGQGQRWRPMPKGRPAQRVSLPEVFPLRVTAVSAVGRSSVRTVPRTVFVQFSRFTGGRSIFPLTIYPVEKAK